MDLTDRIAAHPVAKAAWDLAVRTDYATLGTEASVVDRARVAEAALVAALDAEDRERAELIGELREIARDVYPRLDVGRRLAALIARLEGAAPAVVHDRPDEPAGLTPCCGKTEPRINSEGGILVDEPGEVTCPGEED